MPSRPFALYSFTLACALGCAPPTHVLLSSRCGAAGSGGVREDCEPVQPPMPVDGCKGTIDCAKGEECIKGGCIACAKLMDACTACPPGSRPYKFVIGACVTCECRPDCKAHQDCPRGMVCAADSCVDCNSIASNCPNECAWGFSHASVERNGCKLCECVPKSQCQRDLDCGAGLICYPGAQCDDGCRDPSCCHGNLCSQPGCKPLGEPVSCTVIGCAIGECRGDAACSAVGCRCDPTSAPLNQTGWSCGAAFCDAKCQPSL